MSWQSFFTQLSKPVNKGDFSSSFEICHCNKGALIFHQSKNQNSNYIPQNGCSLASVCSAIQMDKHRAKILNHSFITPHPNEISRLEKRGSKIFSAKSFQRD
jgi:hypothetical protein